MDLDGEQSTRGSTPAAASSVDTCRPSASTSISRPWRREGRWRTACRWPAGRAHRCSPIRRVSLRVSTCAASLQTNGGPSAGTWHRRVPASPSCLSTAPGRCEHFRIPTRPSGHRWHLGTGWTRVRRPGRPRRREQPVAVPARRLGAPGRDDVHVGANHRVPVVTRREDAGDVAGNVFGRCGVDRERRQEGVAVRLIVTRPCCRRSVFAVAAAAQEQRGAIEGTVQDAQHAVLPGATVAALNLAQGAAVSTVADATGTFRFPALAPGYYDITASLPGFPRSSSSAWKCSSGRSSGSRSCSKLRASPRRSSVSASSPLVDTRQSAASVQPAAGHDRPAAQGPRFHDARQAGARRQPGAEARGHLHRRVERLGEPVRGQRHRDHEPAQRRVGPCRPAGVRRRDPGEVERLRRRVRRLDRRRDQRRHQERHQRRGAATCWSTSKATRSTAAGGRPSAGCPPTRRAPST